ncbi:hypothetical protein EVA_11736 [gut metagenome]|uniref:Uncharacterized protein n=1 Tax=gut metagenome TaxID=749906 RepID=J9G005_9ZZZZ
MTRNGPCLVGHGPFPSYTYSVISTNTPPGNSHKNGSHLPPISPSY